jgi:hypothetical protein
VAFRRPSDGVALRRGRLIYCVEEADNPGDAVQTLATARSAAVKAEWRQDLFGGVMTLTASASRLVPDEGEDALYAGPTRQRDVAKASWPESARESCLKNRLSVFADRPGLTGAPPRSGERGRPVPDDLHIFRVTLNALQAQTKRAAEAALSRVFVRADS